MQSADLPDNETSRLAALQQLGVLDSGPEQEFDALIQVASLVCGVPISLISLIDSDRQWFKANIGLPGVSETPRDLAFCAHAILGDQLFEVPDATRDPRFFDNPLVTSAPDIRFYAGQPIVLKDGNRIGTLCVIDRVERQLSGQQREIMSALAVAAAKAFEGRQALLAQLKTESELLKSKALLERTGALAGVGGWEIDLVAGTIDWADETCRIHGEAPGYMPTLEEALNFFAPDAQPMVRAALQASQGYGQSWDLELPLMRRDGECIWVRALATVEFDGERPARLMGAFQDITVLHRERLALLESQERMRLATEVGGIGIWSMDVRAGTASWDAQSYRLLGLDPSDPTPIMDLWRRHVHPDDQAKVSQALHLSITTGQHYACDCRVIRPDQSIRYLMSYGRVSFGASGKAVSIVGTNMDVTQARHYAESLKEARDKAEQASQSRGQFLANMSHEIRTPMNAILGMLSLLQNTHLNARQSDYATKAGGAAKSLLGLLNDILDFSKVDAGKMTLECEPFQLEKLLRELSVVLSANVDSKNLEILFDVDPALPEVVAGDAMRLQQVLINLGGNAVKFTSQGQVVIGLRCASLTEDAVTIEFEVKDTGIGIAPESLAGLFNDFSQAEASTTRRFGGTGLGLAICRRLVKLMGGEIRITSTPGVGSSFAFFAVLQRVRVIPAELLQPASSGMAPQHVLVVDDNPVAGDLMQRMMQSLGWTADLASSGAQALEMIGARMGQDHPVFPYHTVVVDWQMPGMDGWETTRRIRHISQSCSGPQPVVIMATAHGRETLAQRSQIEQDMLNGFLVKPMTAAMVREAVASTLAGQTGLGQDDGRRSSHRGLDGLRILVVEDNLINQQVAEELLVSEGAMVFLAANGQLGVEAVAAAEPQFDVVLMDLQMPVLDGFGATRAIRDQLGLMHLPIVAMTANALASDRDACLAAGMDEHVGKPFDLVKLVSLLVRLTSPDAALPAPMVKDSVMPTSLVVPGLDVAAALARMSGMTSLYVRIARDFSKELHTISAEIRCLLEKDEADQAVRLLHTLKGNARTLGAQALARDAGQLELLCHTPAGRVTCLARLNTLSQRCDAVRLTLGQVIDAWAPDTGSQVVLSVVPLDRRAASAALVALDALLVASDLSALMFHDNSRGALAGLPAEFEAALNTALENLDFQAAHIQCVGMLAQLGSEAAW
jgi:signal transduction histidine kinase/CheY-like chemotaxis protein